MRYPASEKLEIIRLVERSHLPVRRTLDKLGIPTTTFYRWYDRYRAFDEAGLEDRNCGPGRVWNRIPDDIRGQIVELALDEPELSPRELAVTFTDAKGYFISEASVYRLLKANDLITSPAFVVIKAADEFLDKTTAPNQLWQTDFTYLKVVNRLSILMEWTPPPDGIAVCQGGGVTNPRRRRRPWNRLTSSGSIWRSAAFNFTVLGRTVRSRSAGR